MKRLCLVCGTTFKTRTSYAKWYCSNYCKEYMWASLVASKQSSGLTKISKLVRTSHKYLEWRKEVLNRDNYTCQLCKEVGNKLEVNHIKKFSEYPELRIDLVNGITLCKECHRFITGKEKGWENVLTSALFSFEEAQKYLI